MNSVNPAREKRTEAPASQRSDLTSQGSTRPTTIRYTMVFLAMCVAILLYLDRICLSTASNAVRADLGLSSAQLDHTLSAFFWSYALCQLPAGWLGDRFGARYTLAIYVALWSLTTALLGVAGGLASLVILRLACGMFEAGAYPLAAGIVGRWIPLHQRGVANSVVALGGRLGGALAPIFTVQLMLLFSLADEPAPWSWRPVMMIYGIVGIGVAILFVYYFRDWPHQHPRVNQAELAIIGSRPTDPQSSGNKQSADFPPVIEMSKNISLWLNSFAQFASNFGWAFLVTSMPKYLQDVHHTSASTQGWLQSLPLACGILGMITGGALLDFVSKQFGLRIGRMAMICIPRILVGIAFVGCTNVSSPLQATLLLAIVGFTTDLGVSATWAYGQDVGGRHVGSVVGWANMWGNLGAACSPLVFGAIARMYEGDPASGWQAAFLVCAAVQAVAAIAALGINASKPLIRATATP